MLERVEENTSGGGGYASNQTVDHSFLLLLIKEVQTMVAFLSDKIGLLSLWAGLRPQ